MPNLQEIKARRGKITQGKWEIPPDEDEFLDGSVNCGDKNIALCNYFESTFENMSVTLEDQKNNADFIANSPTDIDWLIGEVERLREERKNYRRTPMTRLTDERIAEIGKLATALLPRGDWLVFEVADVVRELRDACKDLLAEVKALRGENENIAKEHKRELALAIDDYYNAWANHQVEMEQLKKQLTQAEAEGDVLITTLINRDEHPRINCCGNPDCYNCWVKYAKQQVVKKQNHVAFLRAELATVNDILATLSEKDVMGRMTFEGRKIEIEAELQQAETEGVKHGRSFF